MAIQESPIPPQVLTSLNIEMMKLVNSTQLSAIATLAAAIVGAKGKPTSIKEVMEISNDLQMAMFPQTGSGAYQEWVKTRDARLAKVYE